MVELYFSLGLSSLDDLVAVDPFKKVELVKELVCLGFWYLSATLGVFWDKKLLLLNEVEVLVLVGLSPNVESLHLFG